jgi:Uma2 family endonuclease
VQEKMLEYIANGAEMGLLVDPEENRVHVYRRDRKTRILKDPKTVSCDPILPRFTLDLREIW